MTQSIPQQLLMIKVPLLSRLNKVDKRAKLEALFPKALVESNGLDGEVNSDALRRAQLVQSWYQQILRTRENEAQKTQSYDDVLAYLSDASHWERACELARSIELRDGSRVYNMQAATIVNARVGTEDPSYYGDWESRVLEDDYDTVEPPTQARRSEDEYDTVERNHAVDLPFTTDGMYAGMSVDPEDKNNRPQLAPGKVSPRVGEGSNHTYASLAGVRSIPIEEKAWTKAAKSWRMAPLKELLAQHADAIRQGGKLVFPHHLLAQESVASDYKRLAKKLLKLAKSGDSQANLLLGQHIKDGVKMSVDNIQSALIASANQHAESIENSLQHMETGSRNYNTTAEGAQTTESHNNSAHQPYDLNDGTAHAQFNLGQSGSDLVLEPQSIHTPEDARMALRGVVDWMQQHPDDDYNLYYGEDANKEDVLALIKLALDDTYDYFSDPGQEMESARNFIPTLQALYQYATHQPDVQVSDDVAGIERMKAMLAQTMGRPFHADHEHLRCVPTSNGASYQVVLASPTAGLGSHHGVELPHAHGSKPTPSVDNELPPTPE